MKFALLFFLFAPRAYAGLWNPVAFIGQVVLGGTTLSPLSVDSIGGLASGILNYEVSATADTTTISTTDGVMAGMTTSPSAGTYLATFSTCVDHSAQSIAVVVSMYAGGVQKADSVRSPVPRFNGVGANTLTPCLAINGIVTTTAGQAVTINWKTASGTATAHQRTLNLLRIY